MSFSSFDPESYGTAFSSVIDPGRLCELGPGDPNRAVRSQLDGLSPDSAFQRPVMDQQMAHCCISGVWLLNDFLDDSHKISQDVGSTTGSYWHGIMHRREPDFPNAKYWFRQVGEHSVFEPLAEAARQIVSARGADQECDFLRTQSSWDPFAFVDLCQAAISRGGPAEQTCREIARAEWRLLFDFCYQRAM